MATRQTDIQTQTESEDEEEKRKKERKTITKTACVVKAFLMQQHVCFTPRETHMDIRPVVG